MNLIILINAMLSGGAEKQLLLLAAGLSRRGIRRSVYWFQATPDHPRTAKLMPAAMEAGVSFHRPAPGEKFDLGQSGRVRARLRREPGTMLWTWGSRADIVGLVSRLGMRGIRHVGSTSSAHAERIYQQCFLWRLLAKPLSAFVSNSHINLKQIGSVAPAVTARTAVIYNAVKSFYRYVLEDQALPAVIGSAMKSFLSHRHYIASCACYVNGRHCNASAAWLSGILEEPWNYRWLKLAAVVTLPPSHRPGPERFINRFASYR